MSTNEADKLKKRQEQLAAWKQKKLQKANAGNVVDRANGVEDKQSIEPVDEEEKKRLERQKRIEEWKKKRLDKPGASAPLVNDRKPKPLLKLKKKTTNSTSLKRSIFETEEIEESRPKFKKPTLEEKKDDTDEKPDEEIDLDKFIEGLENQKSSTAAFVGEEQESEDDGEEVDELGDRLKKLQERAKVLGEVDHSKVDYRPFRKNFYKPPTEFETLTPEEIDQARFELSEITVRGDDCPVPITKWTQLGVSTSIMELFKTLNYKEPSAIQSQALPAIMSGRDVLGVAKTGSGKTLSFVLPMIRHVLDQDPIQQGDGPIGLILTPTRELALQITKEINNFGKSLTSCCCYGGSNIESQIGELKKGVQVIVGTPGRVIDLLTVNGGRVTNLSRVTYLVLDEADRMYDMGFEPQVNKIISQIRPDRQTVLFSATFPRKLEKLATNGLRNPVEIIVGGINTVASEIDQYIELFEVDESSAEEINRQKFLKLVQKLDHFISVNEHSKLLIFVEKQDSADNLMVQLISSDYNCLSLHGGKDQVDRKFAIKEFSSPTSDLNILIATSIAARGLDVKGLDLVVNYDAPSHLEDYIHRVGRTGRAGSKGTAITFVTDRQERAITDILKVLQPPINPKLIEIRDAFVAKMKNGDERYSSGFGGKGLEKLQKKRDTVKDMELQSFEQKTGTTTVKEKSADANTPTDPNTNDEFSLPDFDIIEGIPPETSGPDMSNFHSRITINDLPKNARWFVSNRESISKIIESTSCSITHKGQYYAPNTKPKKDQPPKLYLLVEGLTRNVVERANELLKHQMIEGLQNESQVKGKYIV